VKKRKSHLICLAATSLLVAAGSTWGAAPGTTHTVGGTISGLTGKGLVLRLLSQSLNTVDISPPPGAVRFAFPSGMASGSAYAVTVQSQPTAPNQRCAITRGQGGRIGSADVADVMVDCNISAETTRPPPNPLSPRIWDLYVDAFEATVDIENISYSDGYCSMADGTVNATFRESPDTHGKVVESIEWNPQRTVEISIVLKVDSDATVAAQSGQSSPGVPLRCAAMSHHFKNNEYRLVGKLPVLTGPVTMTSPMPQDDDTYGNIGCPPEGNTCHVEYWFDNSPGTAQTVLDLPTLLATGSVVMPIHGTAHNVAGYGETRSGDFKWSGSVTLRAVQRDF